MPEPNAPDHGRTPPTLAQFQARATAACTPYQKSAYVPVWRRACASNGDTPLDQITTMDLRILQQTAVAHTVPRTSGRNGRYSGERVVRAMRALFRMAELDGWIDHRHNPAAQLPLPRRKPSTRRGLSNRDQARRVLADTDPRHEDPERTLHHREHQRHVSLFSMGQVRRTTPRSSGPLDRQPLRSRICVPGGADDSCPASGW